jgi:electron transfer flavoprotein beta subunit
MLNMRAIMPALQRARPAAVGAGGASFASVALPKAQRETRIEKNMSADDIAREIVAWIAGE